MGVACHRGGTSLFPRMAISDPSSFMDIGMWETRVRSPPAQSKMHEEVKYNVEELRDRHVCSVENNPWGPQRNHCALRSKHTSVMTLVGGAK